MNKIENIELLNALKNLSRHYSIATEIDHGLNADEVLDETENLLADYPALNKFADYLEFLRYSGGAHISNDTISLMIYGYEGQIVTSFEEMELLYYDKFFVFGELMYLDGSKPSLGFAFNFSEDSAGIYSTPLVNKPVFEKYANSFVDFINKISQLL